MTTTDPTTTDTYRKIAARLTMLRPQIDLKNYFAGPNPDVRLYDEKPYISSMCTFTRSGATAKCSEVMSWGCGSLPNCELKLRIAKTTDGFSKAWTAPLRSGRTSCIAPAMSCSGRATSIYRNGPQSTSI
ncbi:hypothetical protein [Bradyrhizobium barranii]